MNKEKPDVLCLNEVKISGEKLKKTKYWEKVPEEYEQHWNECKLKRGYSGVAIFTKVKPIGIYHGMGIDEHDAEGR